MNKSISQEENELIRLKIKRDDGKLYECIGVLLREDAEKIRVAFNARNDVVIDYIDVSKIDIVRREKIDMSSVEVIN